MTEHDEPHELQLFVEPTRNFNDSYPLMMAETLVDVSMEVTIKVGLTNPFSEDVIIKPDAVIGSAYTIDPNTDIIAHLDNECSDLTDQAKECKQSSNLVRNVSPMIDILLHLAHMKSSLSM